EFERFSAGRPYGSIIVAKNEAGELRFSGRVFDRGEWFDLTMTLTVGTQLLREESARARRFKTRGREIANRDILKRVAQLLGPETPQKLRNATVGVVGASGTGSPALNILARSKIGKIVVVDPGQAKDSNHQRNLA